MIAAPPSRPTSSVPYDQALRIFIGYAPDRRLAFHVLQHSLWRRSLHRLDIRAIDARGLPRPRQRMTGHEPFALAPFEIPARCSHQGRALYLEPDMLVQGDVSALWALPFGSANVLHARIEDADGERGSFRVLLLDCARLDWKVEQVVADLDEGRYSLDALLGELALLARARRRPGLPEAWAPLERWDEEERALVRFGDAHPPPWLEQGHPHGRPWYRELIDAVATGVVSRQLIDDEVQRGHVAPQVLGWARAALGVRGAT